MSSDPSPIVFAWVGDMHLEEPGRPNHLAAQHVVEELNGLVRPDFVQFPGDNVQHARDVEWKMFRELTGKLEVPWHALVGDHDAHHDGGCHAFRAQVGDTHRAFSLHGVRFVLLNTNEFHPLGLTGQQVHWFRYEVEAALDRGERIVVFQHHYPFKVNETFDGPGVAGWRKIVQTRPIVGVFCGHTHYGQIANDGRNVYVATRSIGDPEGGAAGYALVHLHGDDLAVVRRTVDDRGPIVDDHAPAQPRPVHRAPARRQRPGRVPGAHVVEAARRGGPVQARPGRVGRPRGMRRRRVARADRRGPAREGDPRPRSTGHRLGEGGGPGPRLLPARSLGPVHRRAARRTRGGGDEVLLTFGSSDLGTGTTRRLAT